MSKWRRQGATYIFYGYDPYALLKGRLRVVILYIGKTRRRVETRWREHLLGAPGVPPKAWAPLVTEQRALREWPRITDWWLSTREALSISWHQPRMNILLNKANPHRIPPWEIARVMAQINRRGGVRVLVDQAKADVGVRVTADGTAEWYGKRIQQEARSGVESGQWRWNVPGVRRVKGARQQGDSDFFGAAVERHVPGAPVRRDAS